MKVLIIIKNSKIVGGVQSVTNSLAKILTQEGADVHILSNDISTYYTKDNCNYGNLPSTDYFGTINTVVNANLIKDYIIEHQITHVLIQSSAITLLDDIYVEGTKYYSTLHSMPYWTVIFDKAATKNKLGLNKHLLKYLLYPFLKKRYKRLINLSLIDEIKKLNYYITLSPSYTDELKRNLRIIADKIISIPNPIFPQLTPIQFNKKENIIVYVGRLNNIPKRVDRLIKVWSMICHNHKTWKLIIIGDDDQSDNPNTVSYKSYLEGLSIRYNCCNIEFIGYQNPESYLQRAKINCLTSEFEGLPMSLIEGLYFGVVPISFNCCGGVEDIISGVGEIIPNGHLKEFAQKLSNLMEDEGRLIKLSSLCSERAKLYDAKKIGDQWLKLFKKG